MPKFSTPERFLLDQWTDARLLEDAMDAVRNRYKGIIEAVLEEVVKNCRGALDYPKLKINSAFGGVGIGRASWPRNPGAWPSGFYLENLRLEDLTSPGSDRPFKNVWIFQPIPIGAEAKLRKAAEGILGQDEFRRWEFDADSGGMGLWCALEPAEDLFKLLVTDEARGFVDCLVAHFESMTKFTAAVDEIFATGNRRGK
jgi:hypothetical protein